MPRLTDHDPASSRGASSVVAMAGLWRISRSACMVGRPRIRRTMATVLVPSRLQTVTSRHVGGGGSGASYYCPQKHAIVCSRAYIAVARTSVIDEVRHLPGAGATTGA